MKIWGIQIASERRLRLVATELSIDNNVVAENALFSFPLKSGGEELRPAPIAYLPHLKCKILDLLNKNERYICICNDNNVRTLIGSTHLHGIMARFQQMKSG